MWPVFRYRAMLAIATAGLGVAFGLTPVAAQKSGFVPPDLSAEVRDMAPTVTALGRYDQHYHPLDRRTTVARADVDVVAADVAAIKQALPAFERAANSSMSKLRAAGKWTTEFDVYSAERLGRMGVPATTLSAIQNAGGARVILQRSASTSSALGTALDTELNGLRKKMSLLVWLQPILGEPVHAGFFSDVKACYYRISYGISCANGQPGACTSAAITSLACPLFD
jgi:hypothetical protein